MRIKNVIITALLPVLCLSACSGHASKVDTTSQGDNPDEYCSIIENGETEYTIIYRESDEDSRLAALELRSIFTEGTSVRASVTDDFLNKRTGEEPGEHEILVGDCDRNIVSEKKAGLKEGQAFFGECNGAIVICTYSSDSIADAVRLFAAKYAGYDIKSGKTKPVDEVKVEKNLNETVNIDEEMSSYITPTETDTVYSIENGGISLNILGSSDALVVNVTDADGNLMFKSAKPCRIYGHSSSKDIFAEAVYSSAEQSKDETITAKATVILSKSKFEVTDIWKKAQYGGFTVDRTVEVKNNDGSLRGFGSSFSITDTASSKKVEDYEYFIPSVIYKDNSYMPTGKSEYGESNTLLSNLNKSKRNFVKETHVGLPLAMARNISTGNTVTLQHLNPELNGNPSLAASTLVVNDSEKYGSIGYDFSNGLNVEYIYPAQIGPDNYSGANGFIYVYHPVSVGAKDTYSMALFAEKTEKFQTAMVSSYKNAYMLEAPEIKKKYDMDTVFAQNCELLDGLYTEWGTSEKAGGFPFAASVTDLSLFYINSNFGMGYVGSQVQCGLFLYEQGIRTGNEEYLRKGKLILDFWSSDRVMGYDIPLVEWSPRDNEVGGVPANRNSQLRKLVDGFEGLYEAYTFAKNQGVEYTQWYNAIVKFADTLVKIQNGDGSYYRRYSINGKLTDEDSCCKFNSIFPVRFLCLMYNLTGNESYKNAALKAANYSYDNIYPTGKYMGGTDDGYNRIDREAGIYAANGFTSIYDLTGDSRFAEAAEHALIYAMSYTFCYDYAVPTGGTSQDSISNPMKEGGLIGLSTIAVCGTNIDTFMAMEYFEMFKEYLRTGEEVYLRMAQMLQDNTKLTTDYDGKLGYLYKGMCCEATNVHTFRYYTAEKGVWLPWITTTFCKPISEMNNLLGTADVNVAVKTGKNSLIEKLLLKTVN